MTLSDYEGKEIVDVIKKSGAYIFDLEWTYKIEIVAQLRETEFEELSDDDESDAIRKIMEKLGVGSGKKVISETLAYVLRSHDKAFIVEAIEKEESIYFNACELTKIAKEDLKGICAISGREPKIITEKDLPEMFQTPMDFADKNLVDLMMCDEKKINKYLFDRHKDLLDDEILSEL